MRSIASLAALAVLVAQAAAFTPLPLAGPRARSRGSTAVQMTAGGGGVNRRAVLALAAFSTLGLRQASAATMTEAEELAKLQAEAARIQEIFDVQKELNANLPSLKDGLKAAKAPPSATDDRVAVRCAAEGSQGPVDAKNLLSVIDSMMASLKSDGEGGMRTVLAMSAANNPVKNMPFQNVINSMRDSEYALLFGKFTSYEIKKPEKMEIADEEEALARSFVDVVVKAPYTTILQNGVQFSDVQMAQAGDTSKLCSVTFRWNMVEGKDGRWCSEGCYVIPAN